MNIYLRSKNLMYWALVLTIIVFTMFLLVGCGPENTIIGKWVKSTTSSTSSFEFASLEFFKDGTVIASTFSIISFTGDYKFIDQGRIRMNWGGLGAILGSQVYEVVFANDNMFLKSAGIALEFKRAK